MGIQTVIFDMDGVLVDSETVWHRVRHDFVTGHGGHWDEADQRAVMGANSRQWSEYIHDHCGVALTPEEIYRGVVDELRASYRRQLPLYPGAGEAVARLAGGYRLGLASSSPLELVEDVLELAGLRQYFQVLVSSDDVARGKPDPDVYREACRRLHCAGSQTVAIEDSANGIAAAVAAGLLVIAVPNRTFPPPSAILARADRVVASVAEVSGETIASLMSNESTGGG